MIPWKTLGTARIPDTDGELKLKQRGDEFVITLGSNQLMSSRLAGSEEALATLAFRQIAAVKAPRVLIGGLGMGFTLRAALKVAPADASIVVAELVPEVVAWARGPMAALHAGSLIDLRVAIEETDVGRLIGAKPSNYDAILLDVDNGPEGLTRESNNALYETRGLAAAKAALKPNGVLAVWSSHPHEAFGKRLRTAGFAVNEVAIRATGKGTSGGARHVIWVGVKT